MNINVNKTHITKFRYPFSFVRLVRSLSFSLSLCLFSGNCHCGICIESKLIFTNFLAMFMFIFTKYSSGMFELLLGQRRRQKKRLLQSNQPHVALWMLSVLAGTESEVRRVKWTVGLTFCIILVIVIRINVGWLVDTGCYVGFFNYLQTWKYEAKASKVNYNNNKNKTRSRYSYMWKMRLVFFLVCRLNTSSEQIFSSLFFSLWWFWPFYSLLHTQSFSLCCRFNLLESNNHKQKSIRAEIKTWKAYSYIQCTR